MKALVVIVILVVLGAATSSRWLGAGESGTAPNSGSALAKVFRGPLRITLEEDGLLTAKENYEIKPRFDESATITWMVEEGTNVAAGDLVFEFEKTTLENRISELESSLLQYEMERKAAETNLELQERDNAAAIEKAEAAVRMAELSLERYDKGEAPNEQRKLELAVEKTSSELERAKERFEQVPALVKQGYFTPIEEEEERIRVQEASINFENAQRDLEMYQIYTRCIDRTKWEDGVKDARRELQNAITRAELHQQQKDAELAQREARVVKTKAELEQLRTEISYYSLRSEKAGIVFHGDPEGDDKKKVGETAWGSWQTLACIPDLSAMQVIVQVHQDEIEKVAVDLPAIVTMDSRKGESFRGKVTEIARVASSRSWDDPKNKTFKVTILLDPVEVTLRAGITAKAEIEVETLPDVLQVPTHAIVPEGGRQLAFVVTDGRIEEREVEIGKNNAHHVEILEGLREGEEILLYDPRAQSATSGGESTGEEDRSEEGALPGAASDAP